MDIVGHVSRSRNPFNLKLALNGRKRVVNQDELKRSKPLKRKKEEKKSLDKKRIKQMSP